MSGASYKILSGRAEGVYTDRRSRFLSYLQPVCAELDARVALDAIRAEHHAARHVCYAVVIDDPSLALSNDARRVGPYSRRCNAWAWSIRWGWWCATLAE